MIMIFSGWASGTTGDVDVVEGGEPPEEGKSGEAPPFDTGAPVEPMEMSVMVEYIPEASEDGEPDVTRFTEGNLTLTQNGPTNRGLIGSFDVSDGSGSAISGDISACWCQAIVDTLGNFEEPPPE